MERYRQDLRTGEIAAILATVHSKPGTKITPLDFVQVPCGQHRPGEPMTDAEMYQVALAMAGVQTSAGDN